MPSNLVMVGQYYLPAVKDEEDKNLLEFGLTWSKQVYTCSSAGCLVTFNSFDDFVNKLKGHAPIDKLGILMHSAENSLSFPRPDPQHPTMKVLEPHSLEEVAQALAANPPAVNALDFLGCRVGRDPVAIWDFLETLGWKKASAFTMFHAFKPEPVAITEETTDGSLTEKLDWKLPYLVQNTTFPLDQVPRPKSVQVFIEFFTRSMGDVAIETVDNLERSSRYPGRSRADPEPVATRQRAVQLKTRYDMAGDRGPLLDEVRITMPATP